MLAEIGSKFRFPYRGVMRNWVITSWNGENERFRCELVDDPYKGQRAEFQKGHLNRLVDAQSIAQNFPVGSVGLGESNSHR